VVTVGAVVAIIAAFALVLMMVAEGVETVDVDVVDEIIGGGHVKHMAGQSVLKFSLNSQPAASPEKHLVGSSTAPLHFHATHTPSCVLGLLNGCHSIP
jgi:hypothetical protein